MSNWADTEKRGSVDDRSWGQWLVDHAGGISDSRFMGAKKDLLNITAQADPNIELAKIFGYQGAPNTNMEFYRHLNPQDSTVAYKGSYTSAPKDSYMFDEYMAKNMYDMDLNEIASYFADYRSKLK